MARLLQATKQSGNGHRPPVAPSAARPADASPQNHPQLAGTEPADDDTAVPFIEVGPSRLIEGSPDVLAVQPVPTFSPAPAADERPAVTFQPLPSPVVAPPGIAPQVIAFHNPAHAASAQYRELLAAVLAAVPARSARALFLTGSTPGVGTTTIALNLAVTAARQGRRVAVVDAARRSAVAARLALCDRPGLNEVLAGTASLDEALQETEQPGLVALTGGAPSAAAPRAAEAYRWLLRQLRQRFDLVLLDGPPWTGRLESTAPGAACDAAFLVVAAGEDAGDLLRDVPAHGVRLVGSVVATR